MWRWAWTTTPDSITDFQRGHEHCSLMKKWWWRQSCRKGCWSHYVSDNQDKLRSYTMQSSSTGRKCGWTSKRKRKTAPLEQALWRILKHFNWKLVEANPFFKRTAWIVTAWFNGSNPQRKGKFTYFQSLNILVQGHPQNLAATPIQNRLHFFEIKSFYSPVCPGNNPYR